MDDRLTISVELVQRLIADQFPQFSLLAIQPIIPGGWNNRSFRLGSEMIIRMPSAQRYEQQVEKEQRFLPMLAPHLPLPITEPVAMGRADHSYPFSWGIYRWIDGETPLPTWIANSEQFAVDLGEFLRTLHGLDGANGPLAGPHNFYRGGLLATYDEETRTTITKLGTDIDTSRATALWDQALASHWQRPPVWLHGDIAPGNLLVKNDRLSAVIDFGSCGTGDPACDLAIAWTMMDSVAAKVFRTTLGHDEATWDRARGWALWKTLITLQKQIETPETGATETQAMLDRILGSDFHGNH
ncbi:phosphotransferase [Agrobacterium vitis]|uniref:Phosphotransferase n=1 Tax=Agrobacterium vitis TaxID=373 RepID=A0ABD6GDI6_AGRVI|nr:aminoglycoside phosphotransferase family protein [Agrobacterium vitis]MUO79194.1 phosphotransferase [Agrobacterium vitis]MUO95512.1 phosphotransferase [Agrobacterium vitis]MUP05918.1 phosphotransferase [Agrobacterium vitis]MUZ83002.1 phosphotransferase [Agrobacterium vitis]MVA11624.1 phosphotransferase [Agrobacterium vitis]